jgi:hypothetical protein
VYESKRLAEASPDEVDLVTWAVPIAVREEGAVIADVNGPHPQLESELPGQAKGYPESKAKLKA